MVSTHLKNISQNGNLPQVGVKIKINIWNHHLAFPSKPSVASALGTSECPGSGTLGGIRWFDGFVSPFTSRTSAAPSSTAIIQRSPVDKLVCTIFTWSEAKRNQIWCWWHKMIGSWEIESVFSFTYEAHEPVGLMKQVLPRRHINLEMAAVHCVASRIPWHSSHSMATQPPQGIPTHHRLAGVEGSKELSLGFLVVTQNEAMPKELFTSQDSWKGLQRII